MTDALILLLVILIIRTKHDYPYSTTPNYHYLQTLLSLRNFQGGAGQEDMADLAKRVTLYLLYEVFHLTDKSASLGRIHTKHVQLTAQTSRCMIERVLYLLRANQDSPLTMAGVFQAQGLKTQKNVRVGTCGLSVLTSSTPSSFF